MIKPKIKIKLREIIILVVFIAVMSFIIINVKNAVQFNNLKKGLIAGNEINVDTGNGGESATANKDELANIIVNKEAVVYIPSVNIIGEITTGTDAATLKDNVGRVDNGVYPGQVGNYCIAAHNNIYTEIFRNLHNINIGEEVNIITKTNIYTYKINSKEVVQPTAIEVLDQPTDGKKQITLITCTNMAQARVIVKGELVSEKTR